MIRVETIEIDSTVGAKNGSHSPMVSQSDQLSEIF
jgi:hypothetical protein